MTSNVALVTGASRGIGRSTARRLAERGFRLALVARTQSELQRVRDELQAAGHEAIAIAADLLDPEAPGFVHAQCVEQLGEPQVLINNAGSAPTAPFHKTTDAMLETALGLHVRAAFGLIRACLPAMRKMPNSAIVQLASSASLRGFPYTAAYCAAKHGMVGMTRALRAELGDQRPDCWAVCPGFVDTEITRSAAEAAASRGPRSVEDILGEFAAMNRIGRLLQPEDVAHAVVQMIEERPAGCVLDLDRDPPAFADS